ncbi:MAG: glutamine synthetase type III, partial [Kiritimatiellae bacterium]|nr:glutamine synthetase type III [Kiritimatiellia bacterium]
AINTMVAESLDYIATRLEKEASGSAQKVHVATQKVIRDVIRAHGRVIFNGDNYSAEWHREAEKRGLPNLRNSVDALSVMARKDHVELLNRYKVLSKRELESRQEIYLERYIKEIGIEGRLTLEMARTMIFPAAVSYQLRLAETAESLKKLGLSHCTTILEEITRSLSALQPAMSTLEGVLSAPEDGSVPDHARHARDAIIPAMVKVREIVDRLEGYVADELWPLPTYQEMLFIK